MSAAILSVAGVPYPVFVGSDAEVAARLGAAAQGRQVLVVTDENVAPLYLDSVAGAFSAARDLKTLALPAGERTKSLAVLLRIVDVLSGAAFHRDAILVALGGGVISDLAGFAAACYQRGIDWIAAPTTLLAQVDAAIGGKTAVNHPAAKNLIGAFHDPVAVWAEPARLTTLAEREYRAGFGEVVKYGLGFDAGFFAWLEAHAEALAAREPGKVFEAVVHSARLKLEVVGADPREGGNRALLNLGHTLGHALETALGHGAWGHGEAVAVGLVAAAEVSRERGTLAAYEPARLRDLLRRFGLPTAVPSGADERALEAALALDKKIAGGRLRFIGLEGVGRAVVWNDVEPNELRRAVAAARRAEIDVTRG